MSKTQIAIIFLGGIIIFSGASCAGSSQQTTQTGSNSAQNSVNSLVVSSHSAQSENISNQSPANVPRSETKTKWTQSGEPIDVTGFNTEIAKAEKDLKARPKDETAKKSMADAYVKRAVALTNARQYASALGDYRRALKYDQTNEEAKSWVSQIVSIYQTMNREAPKEGEEPPPLTLNK